MNRKVFWFVIILIFITGLGMIVMRDNSPEPVSEPEPELLVEDAVESSESIQEEVNIPLPEVGDEFDVAPEVIDVVEEDISVEEYSAEEIALQLQSAIALCEEIGGKLGSVSVENCLLQNLRFGGGYSVNKRPIAVRDFLPEAGQEEKSRILIMGGVHGDEYASISIMFKWMDLLSKAPNENILWRFVPSVNPDGLLDAKAVRQNANGVDLNRNFPSQDWDALAIKYWQEMTGRNPRRNPGEQSASEPEVQWVVEQIKTFQPDVIISVHAPYHLLDFDGPAEAPNKIGELYLHELGVYPGSLGNYAGVDLGIPVVTLELPSAGIMPSNEQIETMWEDLLSWVHKHTLQISIE